MSLTAIFAIIIGAIGVLFGAIAGHARGKSVGKAEGVQVTEQKQAEAQQTAQVEAATKRIEKNENVAATTDADLDKRLQEFDRPG